jgi:hypothetical protein
VGESLLMAINIYDGIKKLWNLKWRRDELVEHDEEEKDGLLTDRDKKEIKERVDEAERQYYYIHHSINSNENAEDARPGNRVFWAYPRGCLVVT